MKRRQIVTVLNSYVADAGAIRVPKTKLAELAFQFGNLS
jgi:hypothetical protein